jgi:hypothetical protein
MEKEEHQQATLCHQEKETNHRRILQHDVTGMLSEKNS